MTTNQKIVMHLATIIAKRCDITQDRKWSPGFGMITKAHVDFGQLPNDLIIRERKELIQYLTGFLLAKDPKLTHAVVLEFDEENKTIQFRESLTYEDYPDLVAGAAGDGLKLYHFYNKYGENMETVHYLGYHLIILVV